MWSLPRRVQNSIASPKSEGTLHIVHGALRVASRNPRGTPSLATTYVSTFISFVSWCKQQTPISQQSSNNSFKPNLLRYTNNMAG